MTAYYYHGFHVDWLHNEWLNGKMPGHLLYGITEFPNHGIDFILHNPSKSSNNFSNDIQNAIKIVFSNNKHDI